MSSSRKKRKEEPGSITRKHIAVLIQDAVTRDRKKMLLQLRNDLKQNREYGQNPLKLFPQEIWVMIFENLDDINDLANLKRSCTLFYNMIPFSTQQLLFGKVLPLLVPFLSYNSELIVTCGKVCRKWRSAVNRLADDIFRVEQPVSQSLDTLLKEPEPKFEQSKLLSLGNWLVPPELETGTRLVRKFKESPFLFATGMHLGIPEISAGPTNLCTLNAYGRLVWQLTYNLDNQTVYNSDDLLRWCSKALEKCPNLRQFHLHDGDTTKDIKGEIVDIKLLFHYYYQCKLKSLTLESLSLVTKKPGILVVQDYFIQQLSHQLKNVELRLWNSSVYHTLSWRNLTHLNILEHTGKHFLKSLQLMQAPKLHKLSITLDSTGTMIRLFNTINSFISLRHLEVALTKEFAPDISSVKLDLLIKNEITTLEIISSNVNKARSLSVCFPRVRILTWRYGNLAIKHLKNFDDTKSDVKEMNCSNSNYAIQIFKNMYKSNLWDVFSQLRKFTVEYVATTDKWNKETGTLVRELQIFSRKKYIWETEKYRIGIQNHLEKIHSAVKTEIGNNFQNGKAILPSIAEANQLDESDEDQENPETCTGYTQNRTGDCTLQLDVPLTEDQREDFISYVNKNQDKPWFAQQLEIQIQEGYYSTIVKQAQSITQTLGKHVRLLKISSTIGPNMKDFYKIFECCMTFCPNLESFTVNIPELKGNGVEELTKLVQLEKFPQRLNKLAMCGPDAYIELSLLNHFLSHLQEKLGDQITNLKQDQCPLQVQPRPRVFPELTDLTVRKYDIGAKSLLNSKWIWPAAPNLEKLHVCVSGCDISVNELAVLAMQYPELWFLEIQFAETCCGLAENVIYSDPTQFMKITELQIVMRDKYQARLDFLILFPLLKTLRVIYGKHAPLLCEETDWEPDISYEDLKPRLDLPTRTPMSDFIQLVKYFGDGIQPDHNKKEICGSKIWTVLPKMRKLEVVHCPGKDVKDAWRFYRT